MSAFVIGGEGPHWTRHIEHVLLRPVVKEVAVELLREMYEGYAESVGLDPNARYLHGTPLRPVVPLDTGVGGVFVLGAYPSARFSLINKISDVPVADNLGPFESERWFDGATVRRQPSAKELDSLFLQPLGLQRSSCWITDLVKVFLFKPGHVRRYRQLNAMAPVGYMRERFCELGEKSLPWIRRELDAAKPRLLITLGSEVAAVLRGVSSEVAQRQFMVPKVHIWHTGSMEVATVHCAHPGILMRPAANNRWPVVHRDKYLPVIKAFLDMAVPKSPLPRGKTPVIQGDQLIPSFRQ